MSEVAKTDLVTCFIDGVEVSVPKGTLAIRAAEKVGVRIPRFCDHPLLDPVGACRQCLVEVPDAGNGRGFPKPQASCTLEVMEGMQIATQYTSPVAEKAQRGVMELLLINHPFDCPICDKGGECPLQNQAMSTGRAESRYDGVKRTYPKPVSISSQILLDRERCVLCARCTRFSEQIAGDPFITLVERGALQQVGFYESEPYNSYFSGNVVQICPVGALTAKAYRFQSRPFDLVSTAVTCENCAAGCQLRTDHRHYQVKRRQAGEAPEINEEWSCDKGRFAFVSGRLDDRLTTPMIRDGQQLRPASWPEAIDAAVAGLREAKGAVGVLTGGRLTMENAYGYAKFARTILGTNNIDCRARAVSTEETDYLAAVVAAQTFGAGVTYRDLETAKRVVLVCFEPEEESPMVFLRLRKANRKNGTKVVALAPYLTEGNAKCRAELVACRPGVEVAALPDLGLGADDIVLVGERAVSVPGLLSALSGVSAKVAWIPRRAGERGAIAAGAFPNLLPGGRPVTDKAAITEMQTAWGVELLANQPGLDTAAQLQAAADGRIKALVLGGCQLRNLPNPSVAQAGLQRAFVISIEQRCSDISPAANVIFPVALLEEQAGTFLNWEHREGVVNRVITQNATPITDLRVLAALADAMRGDLGVRTAKAARAELAALGQWDGERVAVPNYDSVADGASEAGTILASWTELLADSACLDGESALAGTAKPAVIRLNPELATRLSLAGGELATVANDVISITLPVAIEPSLADETIWVPGVAQASGTVVNLTVGGIA